MDYPGNRSLSEEIRQRVQQTFEQTLALAEDGKVQEARLGCDFILRLDADFQPAQALRERLEGADGPVDTSDLAAVEAPETEAQDGDDGSPEEADASSADEANDDFRRELAEMLERRELRTLVQLAEEHRAQVAADPELVDLVKQAQTRLEAEPYVRSFLDAASRLNQEGKKEEAEAELEKARELDPTHPELWTVAETEATTAEAADDEADPAPAATGDDDKIGQLLAEGQGAFDAGQLQEAIDAWSRIFLIDIDHAEASERIEKARTLKAEQEREVEEIFHEGLSLHEMGSVAEARQAFERVLELAPEHIEARQYLDQMSGAEPDGADDEAAKHAPPRADDEAEAEPDASPSPEADAATTGERPSAPRPQRPQPQAPKGLQALLGNRFLLIGGVVLLVALAVAWFLYSRRDGLFPNSDAAGTVQAPGPIERAESLHGRGETANAIALLRRVPTQDPRYAEAQALIAQWETLVEDEAPPGEPEPLNETELEQHAALVRNGREAARQGRFLDATEQLGRAHEMQPLESSDLDLLGLARDEIADLERPLSLFRQGDWEFALPDLWQLHQTDPDDRDVQRLMVDCYYNLGIRNLQRRDVAEAVEMFDDAAALGLEDAELDRVARFATTYADGILDLRYRIFVKYLKFR